jgi:UDP-N-acetylmuramate--alanine ligase
VCKGDKMLSSVDFSGRPFHFIGVGGIGMSALAYVLAKRKFPVSGSDQRLSHITQRLQGEGVHVFWSQEPSNLKYFQSESQAGDVPAIRPSLLPQVVCSTAILDSNAEYRAALELGCPILHRSDVLAALIGSARGISVAGTHGKTTTSSLVGHVLLAAGLDPTVVVGGEVPAWDGNAIAGSGDYLVAEADESDGSLVKFSSEIGVVTNIELDHPDHYNNLDEVVAIFQTFAQNTKILVGCIDSPTLRDRLHPTVSYSLERQSGADYAVDCVDYRGDGTTATVWERGERLGQLHAQLLGQHNLSNALAAVAVGRLLHLDFEVIAAAIASFGGTRRRFEHRGTVNDIVFVDDYAHHPSELKVTLAAARLQTQGAKSTRRQRVVAVFQPHRYSRTSVFLADFATAFADADVVILTDIYAAGEANPGNMSGQHLADVMREHHTQVVYEPSLPAVSQCLSQRLLPGDIVLFLGAGNLNQLIPEVMESYQPAEETIASGMG